MSEENVQLVRSAIETHDAGGDAWLDFVAEDVEIHPDASRWPGAKRFRGREEFRRFVADIDQDFEGSATQVIKEIFATGDRVVARTDWGGTGRASGIDLRADLTTIFTVRDGRIVQIEYFFDHTQALEAAGLRE
jgi:ketosteroid isomerase-like protein